MKRNLLIVVILFLALAANAQKADTLVICPGDVKTDVLIPGTHRWLVYIKMGEDSARKWFSIWSRTIGHTTYRDKKVISVTQEWEGEDTISHTVTTYCDPKTFAPLYQQSWAKRTGNMEFDFIDKTMKLDGKLVDASDTTKRAATARKAFDEALNQYVLNWHLDLEVFPLLPYREGVTFGINYYDPGYSAPKLVYYTVKGSGSLTGFDGQKIACWLLEHVSMDGKTKNTELFYVSKKTREVLKLEQTYGTRYRFKVKLAFAN